MNYHLFRAINNLTGNRVVNAMMKFSAEYLVFIVFGLLAVLCLLRLRERAFRQVIAVAGALVITFVLSRVFSAAYTEKRPFQTHTVHELISHAADQSFPSDHATAAFGIAFAVLVFLSWRWGTVLFLAAVLIGFARVYVGIHYPLDILGGFVAGALGTAIVAAIDAVLRSRAGTLRDQEPMRRVGV